MSTTPNIITFIRTLRNEFDWSYEYARDEAIRRFEERGWPVPESIKRLEGRKFSHGIVKHL
jgi:hypothetical protein